MPRSRRQSQHPGPYDARATVAAGFVSGMLAGLRARNADIEGFLAGAGLSPTILTDPDRRVPLDLYADLYNRVVRALDDEGFGLFSVKLTPGLFAVLCRAMIAARDLEEALIRASGLLHLVLPDLAMKLERDGAAASLEIIETPGAWPARNDPRRVFAFEWLLRLIHGLSCWLVGRPLALDSVQFPYAAPTQASDYALIYTEHPSFAGDRLIARLNPVLLGLPIRRDQDAVAGFLEGAPGKIAMLYRRDHEMVRQIRDILATSMGESLSLQDIADRLHLSLRTVQRRLKQEGAGFRAIKALVRRNMALSVIGKTARPVSEVALELGYTEPSAFFRAFVNWTGEAPTAYRKKLRTLSS